MNLIEDLFLAGVLGDLATRTLDLGDDDRAVFGNFRDRETEAGEIGNILLAGFGVITAGDLTAAFQQVADGRALADLVPIVLRPAELMDLRGQEHRRIGNAAGDDDIRTIGKCLDHGGGTHIGVGGDEHAGHAGSRSAGFKNLGVADLEGFDDIVAGDGCNLELAEAQAGGNLANLGSAGLRICRAHIGDDLDAVLLADRQNGFETFDQQRVITLGRVIQLGVLGDRDGTLCQAFENEVVDVAFFGEFHRRLDAIAGISGSGSDANSTHYYNSLFQIRWARLIRTGMG
ncbi:hypothetical protein D3C80_545700 [compost metagenome]